MRWVLLLFLLASPFTVLCKHVDLPAPYNDDCILENGRTLYNPAGQFDVPWYNVDLDAPASERWREIATVYGENINNLIGALKWLIDPIFPDAIALIDEIFGEMNDKIPQPYRDEIASISKYSGVPLGEIVLYNIFYEIFTVCTSIVAQDDAGKMYHARNLDFGLFLGWNETTHDWMVSAVLRTMVVNINWIKDGKVLFKSNNFAGFVGIYNGLKPNAFTLTANERFMLKGGYIGIIRWLLGMEPNGKWMTWMTREVMEEATSYADAKDRLMNIPLLSPVYYILGGVQPYEGCIIARSLDKTDLVTEMDAKDPDGWFVLETNYDKNKEPLYLDDRDTPGTHCMKTMGKKNVGFKGIYDVLSSRTNLNKLTTYTVLMQVDTGKFETHLQSCPGECWPF